MRTAVLNRTNPETLIAVFSNSEGGQLTNGDLLIWDTAGTLGVSCKKSATVRGALGSGVCLQTVDTGGVGIMQTYGYHSAVKVTTTASVAAGDIICTDTSGKCVELATQTTSWSTTAATEARSIIGVCATTPAATDSIGVFLRLC